MEHDDRLFTPEEAEGWLLPALSFIGFSIVAGFSYLVLVSSPVLIAALKGMQ